MGIWGNFCLAYCLCQFHLLWAQDSIEWLTLGSDYAHTRYLPVDEITPENFEELEEAWVWDGCKFQCGQAGRSTPSYVDGKIITVAGPRRYVIAIDAKSGETVWTYVEPKTTRYEYSMRKDYGKGVTIAEVKPVARWSTSLRRRSFLQHWTLKPELL